MGMFSNSMGIGRQGRPNANSVRTNQVDVRNFDHFFRQYASSSGIDSSGQTPPNTDMQIDEEGTEQFCSDLGFSVLDPVALVWCYHCDVQKMGCFTREEFARGCLVFGGAKSIDSLKVHVSDMRDQLKVGHPLAKRVYMFAFKISLEENQKQLPKELAIEIWKLLLPFYDPNFDGTVDADSNHESNADIPDNSSCVPHRESDCISRAWIRYVLSPDSKKPVISKDVWNTVFDLVTSHKSDLSDYDLEGGAWPVMIDDFVVGMRRNKNQHIDRSGTALGNPSV